MMVIELLFLGSEGAMLVDATLCWLCFWCYSKSQTHVVLDCTCVNVQCSGMSNNTRVHYKYKYVDLYEAQSLITDINLLHRFLHNHTPMLLCSDVIYVDMQILQPGRALRGSKEEPGGMC